MPVERRGRPFTCCSFNASLSRSCSSLACCENVWLDKCCLIARKKRRHLLIDPLQPCAKKRPTTFVVEMFLEGKMAFLVGRERDRPHRRALQAKASTEIRPHGRHGLLSPLLLSLAGTLARRKMLSLGCKMLHGHLIARLRRRRPPLARRRRRRAGSFGRCQHSSQWWWLAGWLRRRRRRRRRRWTDPGVSCLRRLKAIHSSRNLTFSFEGEKLDFGLRFASSFLLSQPALQGVQPFPSSAISPFRASCFPVVVAHFSLKTQPLSPEAGRAG